MAHSFSNIPFVKMHGAGNDYVYIDAISEIPHNLPVLAKNISDRHFGVGGDGLVVILKSEIADFRMRMFNSDGSEAQMCGNASRCIGKFVYDRGLTDKTSITLETLAGIKILHLNIGSDNKVESIRVDMGSPEFEISKIPANPSYIHENRLPNVVKIEFEENEYTPMCVSMGNPHAVNFIDSDPEDYHIHKVGKFMETHPAWPEKTNVEFVRIIDRSEILMRVWERGSGETLACGTGACATVAAGIKAGLLNNKVKVRLLGGTLDIELDKESGHVFMTGKATTVADGIYFSESAMEIPNSESSNDSFS